MHTLVLAMALCTAEGERICSYIDATERMEVVSDQDCLAQADWLNDTNRAEGEPARFMCISPARFQQLSGTAPADHSQRTSL